MISPKFTIDDLIAKTKDLPSMPATAVQVIRETEKSTSNAQSLAKLLIQDQALTARVLRLANSSYYGLTRQVSDLQEAVVILGMRTVRNLALVAGSYPWLNREIKGYELGPKAMWTHSLGVAVGAQLVASSSRKADPQAAFMCGLLHDLGKVVLAVWLEKRLGQIMTQASKNGVPFHEAERHALGFDHGDVGQHLSIKWNLPEMFGIAMKYHHEPNLCEPSDPLVDCVHLGDHMTMSFGMGLGCDGLQYPFEAAVLDRLGLPADLYTQIMGDFLDEYTRYEEMFSALSG